MYIVYKTTNNVNGKIYVGVHLVNSINIDQYLGSGKYLYNAINKYGKNNFVRETLFIYDGKKKAYAKEKELVNLEFIARKDTYNIKIGGKGGGGKWSKETRERMIKALGNRSEDTYKKMSESTKGKNHPMWGKHHTEETKRKIGEAQKGEKSYMWGKSLSGETRRKISEANKNPSEEILVKKRLAQGITPEMMARRIAEIRNEPKTLGWITRLAAMWGIKFCSASCYIKKYKSLWQKQEVNNASKEN